jgi:hypothetical protein
MLNIPVNDKQSCDVCNVKIFEAKRILAINEHKLHSEMENTKCISDVYPVPGIRFLTFPFYFYDIGLRISPQHPVLKHPQSMFLP